jgi:hypothetical protein
VINWENRMYKVPTATSSTSSLGHAGDHADALKQKTDDAAGGFSPAGDDARLDALRQPSAQSSGATDTGSRSPRASFSTSSAAGGGSSAPVPPAPPLPPSAPPPPPAPAFRPAAFRTPALPASRTQSASAPQASEVSRLAQTQATSSTSGVSGAAATTPVAGPHSHDKTPDDIQHAFRNSGLLIRTMQMQHAHKEFDRCGVTVEQALSHAAGSGGHGGLRKWSLAHADLKPQYFMMGEEHSGPRARHLAVLAMPNLAGEHVVGVHEKDQGSGNIKPDTQVLAPDESRRQVGVLLNTLKGKQAEQGNLENCEIQTVGIEPTSMAGLMFNKPGAKWEDSKAQVQSMLSKVGPEFHGRSFPVFTYAHENGQTTLTHIDTLSASSRTPANTVSTE